jgi:hypothetical protein
MPSGELARNTVRGILASRVGPMHPQLLAAQRQELGLFEELCDRFGVEV